MENKPLPFKKWLQDQKPRPWTVEDFIIEAHKRGLPLRTGTVYKWAAAKNTQTPRPATLDKLREVFAGICF